MGVSPQDVKKLREMSGAPMMDCKKALEEAGGDFDRAVIVLRKKQPGLPRPFRAPGYPVLPLVFAVAGVVLIAVLLKGNPATTWPGYAFCLSGIPIYFLWRKRAS